MAKPLKVGLAFFPYAGTSSGTSQVYDLTPWAVSVARWCDSHPEIVESIALKHFADTPITMNRNAAIVWARNAKIDVLVMVDSDMSPDIEYPAEPFSKPFFSSSIEFLHSRWEAGPHVVCAPYCGPPPTSNPYVFYWSGEYEGIPDARQVLKMYSREEAARLAGIMPCAAQPTGLIMFDVRAFELTDPRVLHDKNGWFYYEWPNAAASEKASTEDVTATRDMSLAGWVKFNRDVIFCNWDAWAGHNKVYCVGKPRPVMADWVSRRFQEAVLQNRQSSVRLMEVNCAQEGEEGGAARTGAGVVELEGGDSERNGRSIPA